MSINNRYHFDSLPQKEQKVDLRRRQSRSFSELLVSLAQFLPPQDRALVLAIHNHGKSVRETATLLGQPPRAVGRRVHQLVARLTQPVYRFVLLHAKEWTPPVRAVATAVFIHGKPLRSAAHALGLSYHQARRHRDAVLVMAQAARMHQLAEIDPTRAEVA